MKTYEFINPSDAIHFEALTPEVAALAALFVGGGKCGARDIETGEDVIGLALFGGDGGYEERYGRKLVDVPSELVQQAMEAAHSFRLVSGKRTSLSDWCKYAHSLKAAKQ